MTEREREYLKKIVRLLKQRGHSSPFDAIAPLIENIKNADHKELFDSVNNDSNLWINIDLFKRDCSDESSIYIDNYVVESIFAIRDNITNKVIRKQFNIEFATEKMLNRTLTRNIYRCSVTVSKMILLDLDSIDIKEVDYGTEVKYKYFTMEEIEEIESVDDLK